MASVTIEPDLNQHLSYGSMKESHRLIDPPYSIYGSITDSLHSEDGDRFSASGEHSKEVGDFDNSPRTPMVIFLDKDQSDNGRLPNILNYHEDIESLPDSTALGVNVHERRKKDCQMVEDDLTWPMYSDSEVRLDCHLFNP